MDKIKFFLISKLPISPYFTQIYVTLSSIIVGVVLGSLFAYSFADISNLGNFLLILKVIIVFILTMLIWHHYVTHNQFVAWYFSIVDTFIPFGFTFLLIMLVITIKENNFLFYLFLTLISFGAWIAYYISLKKLKLNKHYILEIYENILDYNFAKNLYTIIVNFNIKMIKLFFILSFINFILLLAVIYFEKEQYKIIFLSFYFIGLIRIFTFNLFKEIQLSFKK